MITSIMDCGRSAFEERKRATNSRWSKFGVLRWHAGQAVVSLPRDAKWNRVLGAGGDSVYAVDRKSSARKTGV